MSEIDPIEEAASSPAPPLKGDLTQGPILRTLVLFAIPTLMANIGYALGQSINSIWVGRLLGEGALAATVNANMVLFMAFAAVMGFGMAATVKIGQRFGSRDLDGARRTVGTGTTFCTTMAIIGSAIGWIWAVPLLQLMATPEVIMDDALAYLRVNMISIPLSTVQLIVGMGLRGAGDARSPLYATILTSVLVITLNPLLILGIGPLPELGITGSALANVLANLGGMLLLVFWVYWRDLPMRLRGRELRYLVPRADELSFIVAKGLPMGAQTLIGSSSSLVMVGLINREGMLTTAAYGAALQLWSYVQMPAFGISTAMGAMAAQSVGAGQHDRVARVTLAGVGSNAIVTILLATVLVIWDRPLLALFLGDGSEAIGVGEHIQAIAVWSWIALSMTMALNSSMRSYGVVVMPLILMAVTLFPLRIGFYFAAYPAIGPDALWWAYSFSTVGGLALSWLLYSRGSWRRRHGIDTALAPEPA